jgi:hypothetical protein
MVPDPIEDDEEFWDDLDEVEFTDYDGGLAYEGMGYDG